MDGRPLPNHMLAPVNEPGTQRCQARDVSLRWSGSALLARLFCPYTLGEYGTFVFQETTSTIYVTEGANIQAGLSDKVYKVTCHSGGGETYSEM